MGRDRKHRRRRLAALRRARRAATGGGRLRRLAPQAACGGARRAGVAGRLAGWQAVSIAWSALPSLARDDALLTLFYAVVLAIGLSVRGAADRAVVVGAVAAGSGALAVATGAALRFGSAPESQFRRRQAGVPCRPIRTARRRCSWSASGRLVLAARREVPLAARAGGLAAAAATLAAWLVTQSKGGGIALALRGSPCWRSRGTGCACSCRAYRRPARRLAVSPAHSGVHQRTSEPQRGTPG